MSNFASIKVRHRRPTAHARARYRCFLPDLAGLAGRRRVEPMSDLTDSTILRCGCSPREADIFRFLPQERSGGDLRLPCATARLPSQRPLLENEETYAHDCGTQCSSLRQYVFPGGPLSSGVSLLDGNYRLWN